MANTQNTPQDKDLSRFVLATIAELSPCSEKELLEEAASRKCRSVSDFSKLVLRCVQQLRAQGFVELIEERLIITGAGRKHLGAKLSAETIDEVLAHIRQILSKNKSSIEREAATQEGGAVERPTSDDTTRWFRSSSAAAPVEEEEILELTSELGGLELVEDEGEIVVEILDEADILELGEATLELTAEATFPEPLLESEVKPERAPKTETPATPQSDPSETDAPTLLESQETTSALERAIAALRGGQVPTAAGSHSEPFQFQKAPQHELRATSKPVPEQEPALEPAPEPEPVPMAVPEPPKPEAEVHTEAKPGSYAHLNPSFGVEPESSLASETIEEPALVLSGIEMSSRGTEELQISAMDEEGPFPPAQTTTHEESVGNPEGTVGIEPNGQSPSLGPAPQDDHVPGPQMSRFGWLVENIPRRMRAHVPVEAEVRTLCDDELFIDVKPCWPGRNRPTSDGGRSGHVAAAFSAQRRLHDRSSISRNTVGLER